MSEIFGNSDWGYLTIKAAGEVEEYNFSAFVKNDPITIKQAMHNKGKMVSDTASVTLQSIDARYRADSDLMWLKQQILDGTKLTAKLFIRGFGYFVGDVRPISEISKENGPMKIKLQIVDWLAQLKDHKKPSFILPYNEQRTLKEAIDELLSDEKINLVLSDSFLTTGDIDDPSYPYKKSYFAVKEESSVRDILKKLLYEEHLVPYIDHDAAVPTLKLFDWRMVDERIEPEGLPSYEKEDMFPGVAISVDDVNTDQVIVPYMATDEESDYDMKEYDEFSVEENKTESIPMSTTESEDDGSTDTDLDRLYVRTEPLELPSGRKAEPIHVSGMKCKIAIHGTTLGVASDPLIMEREVPFGQNLINIEEHQRFPWLAGSRHDWTVRIYLKWIDEETLEPIKIIHVENSGLFAGDLKVKISFKASDIIFQGPASNDGTYSESNDPAYIHTLSRTTLLSQRKAEELAEAVYRLENHGKYKYKWEGRRRVELGDIISINLDDVVRSTVCVNKRTTKFKGGHLTYVYEAYGVKKTELALTTSDYVPARLPVSLPPVYDPAGSVSPLTADQVANAIGHIVVEPVFVDFPGEIAEIPKLYVRSYGRSIRGSWPPVFVKVDSGLVKYELQVNAHDPETSPDTWTLPRLDSDSSAGDSDENSGDSSQNRAYHTGQTTFEDTSHYFDEGESEKTLYYRIRVLVLTEDKSGTKVVIAHSQWSDPESIVIKALDFHDLRVGSIRADVLAAESVTSEKLGVGSIRREHFEEGAVVAERVITHKITKLNPNAVDDTLGIDEGQEAINRLYMMSLSSPANSEDLEEPLQDHNPPLPEFVGDTCIDLLGGTASFSGTAIANSFSDHKGRRVVVADMTDKRPGRPMVRAHQNSNVLSSGPIQALKWYSHVGEKEVSEFKRELHSALQAALPRTIDLKCVCNGMIARESQHIAFYPATYTMDADTIHIYGGFVDYNGNSMGYKELEYVLEVLDAAHIVFY